MMIFLCVIATFVMLDLKVTFLRYPQYENVPLVRFVIPSGNVISVTKLPE